MGRAVPPEDVNGAGRAGPEGDWPGRELLSGSSPREVLMRLCDGDPLEIGARVEEHLRESAVLVDGRRAVSRAAARIAHAAMRYRGSPELGAFLQRSIAQGVEELVEEEGEDELALIPVDDDPGAHHLFLWKLLGIEPQLARRACIAFNRQPLEVRRAFLSVAGDGVSIHDHAARSGSTEGRVRELLSTALRSMGAAVGRKDLSVEGWNDHG